MKIGFSILNTVLNCLFNFWTITFKKSEVNQRILPKRLFIAVYLCAIVVLGKTFFFKDKVAVEFGHTNHTSFAPNRKLISPAVSSTRIMLCLIGRGQP